MIRENLIKALHIIFSGDYASARQHLLSIGFSSKKSRRIWFGLTSLSVDDLEKIVTSLPQIKDFLFISKNETLPQALTILDALHRTLPTHTNEYWVTDEGLDYAETGLDAWACWHLGIDPDNMKEDIVSLLIKMHGYITICQTGDGPILISWSVISVDHFALSHLFKAIQHWPACSHGYQFSTEVAPFRMIASKIDALQFIDGARAQSAFGRGGQTGINAQQLSYTEASSKLQIAQAKLGISYEIDLNSLSLDASLSDTAVIYHVTDQGLFTAAIGTSLPLLFGITAARIVGMPTLAEPTPRPYLDMVIAHVSESVARRQSTLHHIQLRHYSLDIEYQRMTVPLMHRRKVVGAVTIADCFRGIS